MAFGRRREGGNRLDVAVLAEVQRLAEQLQDLARAQGGDTQEEDHDGGR
ncbi:MAG TPA: hypothetical protein VFJ85_02795 [Acidimicrobiales bacterium]|nr:hypothetical protein [Acidimicrobiales bacterium]